MTEWIRVKDRLPPIDKPSLFFIEGGVIHVGNPVKCEINQHSEYKWDVGGWESCNYCGGISKIAIENPGYCEKLATHWMPLPEAPNE